MSFRHAHVRLGVEDLASAADLPSRRAAPLCLLPATARSPRPQNLADEIIGDTRELPSELVGSGTMFRLRVRGDSVINAAITDGDVVVVRQQPQAENGEIVVAMIDGEMTV